MTLAKTEAAGGPGLLPEVLAFSSSLALDRAAAARRPGGLARPRDDARAAPASSRWPRRAPSATGWSRCGERADAGTLRAPATKKTCTWRWRSSSTAPSARRPALLHSARSRNDQVAHRPAPARARAAAAGARVGSPRSSASSSPARAQEKDVHPALVHPPAARAAGVAGVLVGAYGAAFAARRRGAAPSCSTSAGCCRWASGAIAGTLAAHRSRDHPRSCSASSGVTLNGLDTVGDRDFALDFIYADARASSCTPAGCRPTSSTSPPRSSASPRSPATSRGQLDDAAEEEPRRLRAGPRQERPARSAT